MKPIAVIPARGGSKRIPRKNIRDFCGKPMLAWPIEAALGSNCFDRVVVSTDSEEIAELARTIGAEVPFQRPETLADDETGTAAVIRHSIKTLGQEMVLPDEFCCIYATAPFLQPQTIRDGLNRLRDCEAAFAITVTSFPFPIQRAIRLIEADRLEMFWPEHMNARSQDLEESFHDAGQMYWGTTDAWQNKLDFFASHTVAVQIPRYLAQDIDTDEDWRQAELMFQALQLEAGGD